MLAQAGDLLSHPYWYLYAWYIRKYIYLVSSALQRRGFLEVASLPHPFCSACAMAAAEPSRLELDAMRLVGDAMDWVPIHAPLRPVVLGGLGLENGEPIRALAGIAEQDLMDARSAMQVGGAPLNPAAKGKVVMVWRVARMAAKLEKSQGQLAAEEEEVKKHKMTEQQLQHDLEMAKVKVLEKQAESNAGSSAQNVKHVTGLGVINLAEVLDQTLSGTVTLLPRKKLQEARDRSEAKLDGACPKAENPSDEQISVVYWVLEYDGNPYADLAIFGPHQTRMRRKLAMTGLIPAGFGVFRRIELKGPPDLETWTAGF